MIIRKRVAEWEEERGGSTGLWVSLQHELKRSSASIRHRWNFTLNRNHQAWTKTEWTDSEVLLYYYYCWLLMCINLVSVIETMPIQSSSSTFFIIIAIFIISSTSSSSPSSSSSPTFSSSSSFHDHLRLHFHHHPLHLPSHLLNQLHYHHH